jgi:hypothetical protein
MSRPLHCPPALPVPGLRVDATERTTADAGKGFFGSLFDFGVDSFVTPKTAFTRMTLEFYYAVVRMSEDIHQRLPKL